MAERKQKLIHLHSAEALSVAKANAVNMAVGEIAVQAAADKEKSSLWILTSDKANVVQFPSVEKVTSLMEVKSFSFEEWISETILTGWLLFVSTVASVT